MAENIQMMIACFPLYQVGDNYSPESPFLINLGLEILIFHMDCFDE